MHVYRNGILIGCLTTSTGANDRTLGGVFTILEKKRMHCSKKYQPADAEHAATDMVGHRDALWQLAAQSSENPFLIQNISLPTDFRH
jgi:hypothetical protein